MADEKELTLILRARNLAGREVDRLHRSLGKIGGVAKGAGKALLTIGKYAAIGFAGVAAGLALAAPKIFDMGASLEATRKKIKTVFGKEANRVQKWADKAAERMGLTSTKAQGLAANFADLLIPMKFTRTEAAKMSTKVIGLAGALSEWSGGQRSAEEVADILSKAMLGERDALKGLGISITEEDVQQRLHKNHADKLTGTLLAQAKAVATEQLIFEKSKDAQTAYAKGSGTLLARQAALKAKFDTLVETLVTKLTPVLVTVFEWVATKLVPAVGAFVGKVQAWFAENKPLIDQLTTFAGTVLKGVIDAIKHVVGVFQELIGNITSNQGIMDGLRTAADLIAKAFGGVVDAIGFVIDKLSKMIDWIVDAIDWLGKLFDAAHRSGVTAEQSAAYHVSGTIPGKAAGGWVGLHGPELVMAGERGPEYITPNHRLGQSSPQVIVLQIDGKTVAQTIVPAVSRSMFYELQRAAPTLQRA